MERAVFGTELAAYVVLVRTRGHRSLLPLVQLLRVVLLFDRETSQDYYIGMHLPGFIDVVALEIPRVAATDRPVIETVFFWIGLEAVQHVGSEECRRNLPGKVRFLEVVREGFRCTRRFDFKVVLAVENLER